MLSFVHINLCVQKADMILGFHLPMSCRTYVNSACFECEAEILHLTLWNDCSAVSIAFLELHAPILYMKRERVRAVAVKCRPPMYCLMCLMCRVQTIICHPMFSVFESHRCAVLYRIFQ